jgi:hypothetical protein
MPAKLEITIPALDGASYLVEQDLYKAVTVSTFEKDGLTVKYRAWQAATDDLLAVELSVEGAGSVEGSFRLALPAIGEEIVSHWPPYDRPYPEKRDTGVVDGIYYTSRAFEDSVEIQTKAAVAVRCDNADNGKFTVTKTKPVLFLCSTSSNFKSENPLETAIAKVKNCDSKFLKNTEKKHFDWWKAYWNKSWVSIPDSTVERQYYLSLYGTACASRDTVFPPGLFGMWITREQPAWAGDYHLNYNFQAPFYALYSANRLEQAMPFYKPVFDFMERGKYYSAKLYDIPEGVYYPVGIGPLGIETTRWNDIMERAAGTRAWHDSGNVEDEGLFWGQKTDASYCAANISMHFYHTWDRDFAAYTYPFVKACAEFWEKYLKYENGRYVDYNDAIHEGTVGDTNPILALGLIRQTMQTAVDMSELLGIDADRREKWLHIRENMSDYPLMERDGQTCFRLCEAGKLAVVDANSLALQHIYPAEQIGLSSSPEILQIARNTLKYKNYLDGNASNSIFPTAVRIGIDPDTIMAKLKLYSENTFQNGFQKKNPHGVENWSTVPNTVNEMLCSGHQGIVRLFPAWNKSQDAQFHNIRVDGAFLVSAKLEGGEIKDITVLSEQGRTMVLLNPWDGQKVSVKADNGSETVYEGEKILIETEKGVTLHLKNI